MRRRDVLRLGGQTGVAAFVALVASSCGERGGAAPVVPSAPPAGGPPNGWALGSLGPPDANGVRVPSGFTARLVARSGDPVGPSAYPWHQWPDGAGVIGLPDGGWVYVSNSEVPTAGGVSAIRFGPDGTIVDARRLLGGTLNNCSGGATPWGTWLSCEELEGGRVFELDPLGVTPPVERPALGRFIHEAACVDPTGSFVYLTEDNPEGRFYRCKLAMPGSVAAGILQVAAVGPNGVVDWQPVPDPTGTSTPTRHQVPTSSAFAGGEGCWYGPKGPVFTTKLDERVWHYDPVSKVVSTIYDVATWPSPVLRAVDNLTTWPGGGLLVCEDGDDLQVVGLSPDGSLTPVVQLVGHTGSELTGIGVNPAGNRVYVSSQRGTDGRGMIFEISGPWALRRAVRVPAA